MSFSDTHTRFFSYVKAVGTGLKGNRDLSYEECKDAFEILLKQEIPSELIGAFLIGLRLKLESEDELLACVDAVDTFKTTSTCKGVEIGYALDGKTKYPPLMMLASSYLSDIDVHVSGDNQLAPKYGYNPKQFFEMRTYTSNLHFHDRATLNPELSQLTTLRNNINLRTIFNSVEKLNLLAESALIGMHHAPYFEKYTKLYGVKYRRLMILQGSEGTPEILKKTKYILVENGEKSEGVINPEEFGIDTIVAKEVLTSEMMKELLNNPDENTQKMIQLNAAVIAFVYGKFPTVESAFEALT